MLLHPTRRPTLTTVALAVLWLGNGACAQDSTIESPSQSVDASTGGSGGSGGTGVTCTTGVAETTTTRCSDACDNDDNGTADCDDVNCCALELNCDVATYCGQQAAGNPWDGYLDLDDSQLEGLESSKLPAGIHPCHAPSLVRVNYAVDGDTLDVTDELGGDTSGRVRVIGVDTPEVSHGDVPSDCYADEAATFTSQLTDHLVWLTFDAECRDDYGRLLAYVQIGAGTNDSLERQLLRRGFARAYPYGGNRTFEYLFESDEQDARDLTLGMWGACP